MLSLLLPVAAVRLVTDSPLNTGHLSFLAAMIAVACGLYEAAARVSGANAYRAGAGLAIFFALLLAWANLAVGIIGNEGNPLNLLYAGVIAVAAVGAAMARFRPGGTAHAMTAAAIAQAAAGVIAQLAGHFTWPLTFFYIAIWLISAWLFRRAAAHQAAPNDPDTA